MLRHCLTLLVMGICIATAQPLSKYLLKAEALKTDSTSQSIKLAKKAFTYAVKQTDNYNACLSGIFLGNAYRKFGNYDLSTHYDSLAVEYSRRGQDTILRQKAKNNYSRNFIEQLLLNDAERLLAQDSILFTGYYSKETCLWYEMKALCFFNRIRLNDAVAQIKMAQEVARYINDTVATMHAQMMLFKFSNFFPRSGKMELAFEALSYFEKVNHTVYAAQAANIIGYAFETTFNTDKALEYYQKALYFNNVSGNEREAVQTRMHMADAWIGQGNPNLTKPALYAGFHYYNNTHYKKGIAAAAIRLAKIYMNASQFDSAIFFFKITDKVNERLTNNLITAGSHGWQAQMQAKMGNFKTSDSLMELAVTQILQEEYQAVSQLGLIKLKEGGTLKKEDLLQPNRFSQNKKTPVKSVILQQEHASDYERLEKLNWQTGASADSSIIFYKENGRQQLEAENKYRANKYKDTLEIEKLNTSKAHKHVYSLSWMLTAIAVVLLIVSVGLYRQYKSRKQTEKDKIWLTQLRKEVHHRVKNNLGVVKMVVEKLSTAVPQQMPIDDLTARIDSIVLLHEHLYKDDKATEKIVLQNYLEALIQSFLSIYKPAKAIQITINAPVEVDAEIAMNLGLIINELVTNSLKYAFTGKESGTICIIALEHEKKMHLTVTDNGIGLPPDRKAGYGSKVIKGLCRQLDGKYSYQTHNGTIFKVILPITIEKKLYAKTKSADCGR